MSSRHLPPQFRRRPTVGPVAQAHAGVETVKAGVRAAAWRRVNDPDVTLGRRNWPPRPQPQEPAA